jgi:hypothetical protein
MAYSRRRRKSGMLSCEIGKNDDFHPETRD